MQPQLASDTRYNQHEPEHGLTQAGLERGTPCTLQQAPFNRDPQEDEQLAGGRAQGWENTASIVQLKLQPTPRPSRHLLGVRTLIWHKRLGPRGGVCL